MSGIVVPHATPGTVAKPRVVRMLAHIARAILLVLLSPLHLYLSIRRSMTGSSVTLLLIGIISTNIVWGYPWGGIFAACGSLMLVGWVINRIMRPNLKIDFSLPNSAPAGQPFVVTTHAGNRSRLPAMDLSISFASPQRRRKQRRRNWGLGFLRGKATRDKLAHDDFRANGQPQRMALIQPAERIHLSETIGFQQRGIHPLPDIVVTSTFPFHLFRSTCRYPCETTIAVTPRLMTGDEDSVARGLLDSLGGWSHKLLSGDALDYSGSREYQVGMPVRRWDFVSWARLGRPIVREFQSPSIQSVVLVVDTSQADAELLERLLSFAATAVVELTRRVVRVRLYVTGESEIEIAAASQSHWATDSESLLMRLAAAESVAASDADDAVHAILEHEGRCPVLLLSTRDDVSLDVSASHSITILRVEPPASLPQDEPASRTS